MRTRRVRTTRAMDGSFAVARRRRILDEQSTPEPPGFVRRAIAIEDASTSKRARMMKSQGREEKTKDGDAERAGKEHAKFRLQKAYQFAQSQLSGIGMMAFMMWMSGNSVQIFSIMVTLGGVAQPIKAILNSKATFERFADKYTDVTVPRIMFCAIHFVGLCLALNKLNAMGLLPTHASDWVSGLAPPRAIERAYGGME